MSSPTSCGILCSMTWAHQAYWNPIPANLRPLNLRRCCFLFSTKCICGLIGDKTLHNICLVWFLVQGCHVSLPVEYCVSWDGHTKPIEIQYQLIWDLVADYTPIDEHMVDPFFNGQGLGDKEAIVENICGRISFDIRARSTWCHNLGGGNRYKSLVEPKDEVANVNKVV